MQNNYRLTDDQKKLIDGIHYQTGIISNCKKALKGEKFTLNSYIEQINKSISAISDLNMQLVLTLTE